jgi:hypothetical protein
MCSSLWGTDQKMAHTVSETASTMDLLRGWRLLMSADRHRTRELRVEAQRCFRLAQSTVGLGLAAELEAIGREFEKEADDLSASMQAVAYQMSYPGFDRLQQASFCLPKPW